MRFIICLGLLIVFVSAMWQCFWYVRRHMKLAQLFLEEQRSSIELRQANAADKFNARVAVMIAHGTEWRAWNLAEARETLAGSHLSQFMRFESGVSLLGPMRISFGGNTLQMFDLRFSMPFDERKEICFETVAVVSLRELELPCFYLRPQVQLPDSINSFAGCTMDVIMRRYESIYAPRLESAGYVGESTFPTRAQRLLETQFVESELLPHIQDRNWTVEWTGHHLFVYQQDQLIPPNGMRFFAGEVVEFMRKLQQAAVEYEMALDDRLAHAAARIAVPSPGR